MDINTLCNYFCFALLIGVCIAIWVTDHHPVLHPKRYAALCRGLKNFTSRYRRKLRSIDWARTAPLGLGVNLLLVFALTAAAGWWKDPADGPVEILYKGLEYAFAVLEGNSAGFRSYTEKIWLLPHIPSVMVPVFAAATALALIWNYLPHHVPWFSRVWYIFSELEPNSIRMARSLHKEMDESGDTGVFIFLRTQRGKQEPDVLEELKGLNYFFYPRNAQRFLRRKSRRKRILRVFFLTENTDANFNQMQDFLTAAGEDSLLTPVDYAMPDGQFQHELYLLSETESAPLLIDRLRNDLRQAGPDSVFRNTDLRLLDRFRAVSYDLLRRQPLYRFHQGGELHILLLGFGRIGREFFRAAWPMGVMPGCRTEFTICDHDIYTKLGRFRADCPEFREPELVSPHNIEADSEALDAVIRKHTFHYIVVALGDDERNLRVVSRLKRYYRRAHWDKSVTDQPQICVNIEDSVKHAYTESLSDARFGWDKAVYAFGGLDQAFTSEVLMPVHLWAAAREVHNLLNKRKDPDLRLWSEYNRRSSIACAAHTGCYIAYLLDDQNFEENRNNLTVRYQEALKKCEDPDLLAHTEHRRWMAYVRGEGMQRADEDLVNAYFPHLKHHVDTRGRLTPCLVEPGDPLDHVQTFVDRLRKANPPEKDQGEEPFTFRQRDRQVVEKAAEIFEIFKPPVQDTGNPENTEAES